MGKIISSREGLQAIRRIFIVAAAADPNPVQRRVRHIILPPDKQHLLDTLQDELQGRLLLPYSSRSCLLFSMKSQPYVPDSHN